MRIDFSMTGLSPTACRAGVARRVAPTAGSRVTIVALAIAALLLMLYGERWTLEKRTAPDELTVAACFVNVVYGNPCPTCPASDRDNDKGNAL